MRIAQGAFSFALLTLGFLSLTVAAAAPVGHAAQEKVVFGRDILPILSDKCFKCHGPDASSRMADMRLDTPAGAFADRGGRWPIVPGKPEDSLIVKRITSHDAPMPPAASGKSLTSHEIDLISRWIAEGAKYGKLWSFEPLPRTVPVPQAPGDWPNCDIDRFVVNRLKREKLTPSPPAEGLRWLRRVTLDLTGLPPTEEEIAAFEADKGKDACAKVVDRLLASPHFGERLAVDWLDAARYSDSYGYQSDLLMPTWPYRDWVIKSFNDNLPYDKFLTDQLAGDLLSTPSRDQVLATAFNRLHRQSNEGGSIALEFKTEYAVDRVSTFGTAVLGLTVGCARCHDHKFDPITQKEFYQLYAYFNSIDEYGLLLSTEIVPTPSLLLPTAEQETKLAELKSKGEDAGKALSAVVAGVAPRFRAWSAKNPDATLIPDVLAKFDLDAEAGGKFANGVGAAPVAEKIGNLALVEGHEGKGVQFDGENGIVVRGLPGRERWDAFTWSFWVQDPRQAGPVVLLHRTGGTDVGFCGFDLMLEDGFLTARVMRHWPGNAVAVKTKERIDKDKWQHVAWSWDGSGHAAGLRLYVNGKRVDTVTLADSLWKRISAYGDLGPSGGDWSFAQRFRDAGFKGGRLDDVTFVARELSEREVAMLHGNNSSGEQESALQGYYVAAFDPEARSARESVRKAQTELANFEEGLQEISVMAEAKEEIPAYVLARGQYDSPRTEANKVGRGVPASMPPLDAHGQNNRLTLAKWVTSADHPLTARVAVNRFWQILFGTGLVETTENFGVQGSQPSHPELLDYLARKFIDSGWNVKKLFREIVLSATYRQDSSRRLSGAGGASTGDPVNRWLSRGPSTRLSAEMVRDTVLAASGLLTDKLGGPPVNPYQPAGIWQENNTMSPGFIQSKGADLYRRSIYSTWKRTTPVPSMMLFDATSREACTVRRPSTNTPLQALVLLNDVQFVEAARALAELLLKTPGSDASRIAKAFLRLAGRRPDQRELAILLETLDQQRAQFAADVLGATKLVSVGDSKPDPALRATELAAMTVVVQTVLNSDAVVWKR